MMRVMEREPIDMVQIPYNATDRLAERELLPLADAVGLGVLVMSPLGSGDLVWRSLPPNEMEPLKDFGINTWAQALLKWVVADRRVTAVIPATSKVERARENAHAGDEPLLPEEQRERVAWLADRFVR
jgi:aryl-alcohol dehydrogenase-like predicted oxidoreductase